MKWMSKAFVWPFLLLICGCITADIAVIELRTGEMRHPPYSGMRQVVVAVDRKAGTFKTMRRNGSLFAVRTFDAACRQVSEFNVPVFTEAYCGSTHYSLSDDGRRFVYLKDNTHNLYLLDVSTGRETLLWEHVANTELEMPQLEWISESKVLVVLREYGRSDRRTNEVTILDVATGDRKTIYSPVDPSSFDYSLSPDASLLAFQDASSRHDIQGVVKVLDVQKGTLRATLGDGHQLIGEPCWNPDGSELAYVEGRDLKIWTMTNNTTRTLRSFPERFTCYSVVFGNGVAGYIGSDKDSAKQPLVILDSRNGSALRTIRARFNGGVFLLNGTTVVCEVGY